MRSPCCLWMFIPILFLFTVRSVSYQSEVGDYCFPELIVILFFCLLKDWRQSNYRCLLAWNVHVDRHCFRTTLFIAIGSTEDHGVSKWMVKVYRFCAPLASHSLCRWIAVPWKLLAACFTYSSVLKMEAVCSSETSVNVYHATRHHIPEDNTLCLTKFQAWHGVNMTSQRPCLWLQKHTTIMISIKWCLCLIRQICANAAVWGKRVFRISLVGRPLPFQRIPRVGVRFSVIKQRD
jgi:hypothetical protein